MTNRGDSSWSDRIVPIAVKGIWNQVDLGHLRVADFDLVRVPLGIQLATDLQPGLGPGVGDQVDDRGVGQQGPATPVLADEREQPMFDLVPLARSRRQMTDVDRQSRLTCQSMQFPFP